MSTAQYLTIRRNDLAAARKWIFDRRPALTFSRDATVQEYMDVLYAIDVALAATVPAAIQPAGDAARLNVVLGEMNESNGRATWDVLLVKSGDVFNGHSVYTDTIKGRAEYEADSLRHFLGLGPLPDILAYDTDAPAAPVQAAPDAVGTLSVFPDKEATFGFAYDISTNHEGHKRLQKLYGATLYVAAPAVQAAPVDKLNFGETRIASSADIEASEDARQAEVSRLAKQYVERAIDVALAATVPAAIQPAGDAPILWVESEPSTRLLNLAEIINGTCHTVMYHTSEPRTDNPVWPLYERAPAAPVQAAPVERTNLSKNNHVGAGLRWAEAVAKEQASAPEVGASVPAPVLSLGVALPAPDFKALNDYMSALINWARATHTPEVKASELPPVPRTYQQNGKGPAAIEAYGQACYRVGVQRGAEVSAATYSPMLAASRKASELPPLPEVGDYGWRSDSSIDRGERKQQYSGKQMHAYALADRASELPSIGDDAEFVLDCDAVTAAVNAWRASTNNPPSGNVDRWDIGLAIKAYLRAARSPVAAPQPDVLTREYLAGAVKVWFPECAHKAAHFAAAVLPLKAKPDVSAIRQFCRVCDMDVLRNCGDKECGIAKAQPAAPESAAPDCQQGQFSSRVCAKGTRGCMSNHTPAPESAEPSAPTEGWLIEWTDTHGKRRKVCGHNFAGDYRAMGYEGVTATELVRRLATSSAAKGEADHG